MSLFHMTGFDLFGVYVLNILSLTIALLGVLFFFFFFFFGLQGNTF